MKIVFLSYLHGYGGAEKQNILLANAMDKLDNDVTLISIYKNNICYDLNQNIKHIFLPDRQKGIFRFFSRYKDIKKVLNEIKPDITVNFWFQSAYLTAMMKKSITGKVIYSERGDPGDKEYSGLLGIVRKIVFPRIDGFVFQSNGARDYFNQHIREKSIVIHNPVFIKREDYPIIAERKKVIVTMGRLHKQKNQKMMIEAFNKIANEFPEYKLYIYGDGDLKDELQEQINHYKLQERILLKGAIKNIHSLIYNASLFLLSSDYEGLPNALIEAMALGIPCISTDCKPGGAREIIHNNKDGLIIPCGDSEKMAEAIKYLLDNPQIAKEFEQNAILNIKKFNCKLIYQQWMDFMNNLVK